MIALAALLLVQSPDIVVKAPKVAPPSTDPIVAGAKACLGNTVDPAGVDARLAGWADTTGAAAAGITTEGRVVSRDNVMVVVKPGADGGCVVQSALPARFDKAAFLTALGAAVGAPVGTDPANPVTMLPNGEMLVTQIGADADDDGDAPAVQLVFANQALLHAKQHQGK